MPVPKKVKLWLDSGAFSIWVKEENLDVKDYIKYIKRYEQYLEHYIALDVIPGVPGRAPTVEEAEAAAEKTFQNYQRMRDAGLDPIPVFHQGERMDWLYKYFEDEKSSYIGISADKMLDRKTRDSRIHFLDHCFTILTDKQGKPKVRTHGFAITAIPLMVRYPWYSCDSTTWSLIGSYGFILCPVFEGGKPNYSRLPVMVHISTRTEMQRVTAKHGRINSKNFSGDGKQYESFGPTMQAHVRQFIEQECGERLADVRHDDDARRRCVIKFFQKMIEELGDVLFQHRINPRGGLGRARS